MKTTRIALKEKIEGNKLTVTYHLNFTITQTIDIYLELYVYNLSYLHKLNLYIYNSIYINITINVTISCHNKQPEFFE